MFYLPLPNLKKELQKLHKENFKIMTRYESNKKTDIQTEGDIRSFVDDFYHKAQKDDLLGPVFEKFTDFKTHLPKIYQFWYAIIRNETQDTALLHKHVILPIRTVHFERWLDLFTESIDNSFEGRKATKVKKRAKAIAKKLIRDLSKMKSDW